MSIINDIMNRIREKFAKRTEPSQNELILTVEEICASLKEREGFSGSYEDLVKHVRMFFSEMPYHFPDGFTANTGYFSIHPVVDEVRFPYRTRLRSLARSVVIDAEKKTDRGYIEFFTDTCTGMVNERITPGGTFIVTGNKLKIEGTNPDCGVWFVLMVDVSLRFKVTAALTENTGGKLSGVVPVMPAGKYMIEIKTQYTEGGVLLKEPRSIKGGFALRNYKILSTKDKEKDEEADEQTSLIPSAGLIPRL